MDAEGSIRRDQLINRIKWGLGLAAALVASPFVYLAIKGIVGLAIAAATGLIIINLAPVFADKLANWRLHLLVGEAEANPIETLQNSYIEGAKEIEAKDRELEEWDAEIRNLDDELEGIRRDYPDDAARYEAISKEMHAALEEARAGQRQAREDLSAASATIVKARRLYKMALQVQRVTSFSRSAEQRVLQEIKQQAALDSVRTNLNRSLARLNTAMARRGQRPAETVVDGQPAPLADRSGSMLKIPAQVKVGA